VPAALVRLVLWVVELDGFELPPQPASSTSPTSESAASDLPRAAMRAGS
jgi:hypothetical protein